MYQIKNIKLMIQSFLCILILFHFHTASHPDFFSKTNCLNKIFAYIFLLMLTNVINTFFLPKVTNVKLN